jgi:hypothetical protein
MQNYIKSFLILFFGVYMPAINAVEHYNKLWTSSKWVGPLRSENDAAKYYFDARLNLIEHTRVFEQAVASAGIGYQTSSNLQLFLVNSYVITERLNGQTRQEYRLWQQANWVLHDNSAYSLASRSRLEERKDFEAAPIAIRFRELLSLRIPIASWPNHYYLISDEVFFNLNRPYWVSDRFFQQNRAFIGISTDISKKISVDVGYMNQYLFGNSNQSNNILVINFNVSPGVILHLY